MIQIPFSCKIRQEKAKKDYEMKRREYDQIIKECEEEQFGKLIQTYFLGKLTHRRLLEGIQRYYRDEKQKDPNFMLSLKGCIELFTWKTTLQGTNYKRQHVFEALCRLLLYFQYDKGELGVEKHFYESLESFIQGNRKDISDLILDMDINEGSKAGIVDIFFKNRNRNTQTEWACKETTEPKDPNEYIMIQNKYYETEKSNISNYDVTRIYALADLTAHEKIDGVSKIILMVNNEDAVSTNLRKSKQQYSNLPNKIYGVSSINVWFQLLLYDLLTKDLDAIVKKEKKHGLTLRFHQTYVVDCTQACIQQGTNMFIWGAVPRSGKSYMIGGMIEKRQSNHIVLILGAKTETLSQFQELFSLPNFDSYTMVTDKEGDKNIYVFSQEWFKDKLDGNVFTDACKKKYPRLFQGSIDLYFDEIHKGGSTDKSEAILHAFHHSKVNIELFVMVTATFAKPNIRYPKLDFIGKKVEVIEWSYTDQQSMKDVTNETKKEMLIHTREGIQRDTLQQTFDFYQQFYGGDYLNALSEEYQVYPELVLLTHESIPVVSTVPTTLDVRNVFIENLKCDACMPGQDVSMYRNPATIFNRMEPVEQLLDYIRHNVYNYFANQLRYPDGNRTELWFLPDKYLYVEKCDCKRVEVDTLDEDMTDKTSIPNIEPLTRGLAMKLQEHEGFQRYAFFIVHNTKLPHPTVFDGTRIQIYDPKRGDLSGQIKEFERDSYRKNKSVILLTGAKLRLGISLPCADIAFNFDDIKSIDNNYQTMFRVLTERPGKKYGYYLDFNKDRTIQFLYEYDKIYGPGKDSETVESVYTLLFTFHYNGLTLTQGTDTLQLYRVLMEEIKGTYTEFWTNKQNMTTLIKKSLLVVDEALLQELSTYMNAKVKKRKDVLKEGVARTSMVDKETYEEEKEEKYHALIDEIAEELPSIIVLIAMFSDCSTMEDCLRYNIDTMSQGCSCETIEDANVLDCFLNSPGLIEGKYKYSVEQLKRILQLVYELIQNPALHKPLSFIFTQCKTMSGIIHMTVEEIEQKIEQFLTVRKEEKDQYGEVFTPFSVIQEMLDQLPPTVWKDPTLTWLDPANGIGNFPMVVYKRLMHGLEAWEPNAQKRSTHILSKMLYMIELNPKNVKLSKKIFSSANILCGNFLEMDVLSAFKVDKIDIIIGNPPYNENGTGKGGGVLWVQFVHKSFDLLQKDGYLSFIHPTGWRKPVGERASAGDIWDRFRKHNLLFLKISDVKIKYFPRVDHYVVQKSTVQKPTHVVCEYEGSVFDGMLDLYSMDFIPHCLSKEVLSLLHKVFGKKGERFTIIRNQSFQPKKDTETGTPHTFYYDVDKKDYVIAYKMYDTVPEYVGKPKVVMTYKSGKQKGHLYAKYYEKPMGSSANTMYQVVNKHPEQMVHFLNSPLVTFLLKITQYSESPNHVNELKILNKIAIPTEHDIYSYYHLTKSEIDVIQKPPQTRRVKGGKRTRRR